MRSILAFCAAPILAITGFRFSKDYRWGTTKFYRAVYAILWTTYANQLADELKQRVGA